MKDGRSVEVKDYDIEEVYSQAIWLLHVAQNCVNGNSEIVQHVGAIVEEIRDFKNK